MEKTEERFRFLKEELENAEERFKTDVNSKKATNIFRTKIIIPTFNKKSPDIPSLKNRINDLKHNQDSDNDSEITSIKNIEVEPSK
jgi:hypothetical protein